MFVRRYFHPQLNVFLEYKHGRAGPDRNLFQLVWRCLMLKQGQHVVMMLLWYPFTVSGGMLLPGHKYVFAFNFMTDCPSWKLSNTLL